MILVSFLKKDHCYCGWANWNMGIRIVENDQKFGFDQNTGAVWPFHNAACWELLHPEPLVGTYWWGHCRTEHSRSISCHLQEQVLIQSWLLTTCFAEHLVPWHPLSSLAVWAHKSLNTSVLQSSSKIEALSLLLGFVVMFPWDLILIKGLRLSEFQQRRHLRRICLSHPLFNCLDS